MEAKFDSMFIYNSILSVLTLYHWSLLLENKGRPTKNQSRLCMEFVVTRDYASYMKLIYNTAEKSQSMYQVCIIT